MGARLMADVEVLSLLPAEELPPPVRRARPGRGGHAPARREPNRVAQLGAVDGGAVQGELLSLVPEVAQAPVTQVPVTQVPVTQVPARVPVTQAPVTEEDSTHDGTRRGRMDQERPAQPQLPLPPALPVAAAQLLGQAHRGLAEATVERTAPGRYATAHLAALRAAAAVLAARTQPETGRRRPRSAWVLIGQVAPELAEWATFFAAGAAKRAAAEAGLTSAVTEREADDLVRDVATFLRVVESAISRTPPGAPARPRPGAGDGRRPPGRPRPRP